MSHIDLKHTLGLMSKTLYCRNCVLSGRIGQFSGTKKAPYNRLLYNSGVSPTLFPNWSPLFWSLYHNWLALDKVLDHWIVTAENRRQGLDKSSQDKHNICMSRLIAWQMKAKLWARQLMSWEKISGYLKTLEEALFSTLAINCLQKSVCKVQKTGIWRLSYKSGVTCTVLPVDIGRLILQVWR